MLLTRPSQYAIAGLLRLAASDEQDYCRLEDLLDGTDAPRHAVAKVFYRLAKRGLVTSARGTGGGFRLAEAAWNMTVMDVVEAVEGPWINRPLTERGLCNAGKACILSGILQPVWDQFGQRLRSIRLGDLFKAAQRPGSACCGVKRKVAPEPAAV